MGSIRHQFVSTQPDDEDTGSISPTDWNATHDVEGAIEFVIGGTGSAITTGIKGDIELPFAGTFTAWRLLADQSGSIVIDLWKDTYANFPPTNADAMPGTGKELTISSATKAEDTAITDWTTDDFAKGDILRFNVDSCTSITQVTVSLSYTES